MNRYFEVKAEQVWHGERGLLDQNLSWDRVVAPLADPVWAGVSLIDNGAAEVLTDAFRGPDE